MWGASEVVCFYVLIRVYKCEFVGKMQCYVHLHLHENYANEWKINTSFSISSFMFSSSNCFAFSVMGPMSSRFSKVAVWAQRVFNRFTSSVNLPISPRNTSLSNSISCHNGSPKKKKKKKKPPLFELVHKKKI